MTSQQGASDLDRVYTLLSRYEKALSEVDSLYPTVSMQARETLDHLFEQAHALYDEIVSDPVRWQKGLATGAVPGLQRLRDYAENPDPGETYGAYIPDSDLLMERAVEAYRCAY